MQQMRTPDPWSQYLEARSHLTDGFSVVFSDDRSNSVLDELLLSAQFGAGAGPISGCDRVEAFDFAMERLGGTLGALAIIADRAGLRFADQVRRGGKDKDYARRRLFF